MVLVIAYFFGGAFKFWLCLDSYLLTFQLTLTYTYFGTTFFQQSLTNFLFSVGDPVAKKNKTSVLKHKSTPKTMVIGWAS